jgi:hypothetical protein
VPPHPLDQMTVCYITVSLAYSFIWSQPTTFMALTFFRCSKQTSVMPSYCEYLYTLVYTYFIWASIDMKMSVPVNVFHVIILSICHSSWLCFVSFKVAACEWVRMKTKTNNHFVCLQMWGELGWVRGQEWKTLIHKMFQTHCLTSVLLW